MTVTNPQAEAIADHLQTIADEAGRLAGVSLEILFETETGDSMRFVLFAGGYEVDGPGPMTGDQMERALLTVKGVVGAAIQEAMRDDD